MELDIGFSHLLVDACLAGKFKRVEDLLHQGVWLERNPNLLTTVIMKYNVAQKSEEGMFSGKYLRVIESLLEYGADPTENNFDAMRQLLKGAHFGELLPVGHYVPLKKLFNTLNDDDKWRLFQVIQSNSDQALNLVRLLAQIDEAEWMTTFLDKTDARKNIKVPDLRSALVLTLQYYMNDSAIKLFEVSAGTYYPGIAKDYPDVGNNHGSFSSRLTHSNPDKITNATLREARSYMAISSLFNEKHPDAVFQAALDSGEFSFASLLKSKDSEEVLYARSHLSFLYEKHKGTSKFPLLMEGLKREVGRLKILEGFGVFNSDNGAAYRHWLISKEPKKPQNRTLKLRV